MIEKILSEGISESPPPPSPLVASFQEKRDPGLQRTDVVASGRRFPSDTGAFADWVASSATGRLTISVSDLMPEGRRRILRRGFWRKRGWRYHWFVGSELVGCWADTRSTMAWRRWSVSATSSL
ncbi:hypothetical protein HPP92_024735 [Vanilla planifolia]|uniref:Uncharacterized protein n=1 Tax=Vanilla planifolia TaxID=51239 RepID=A0A835UBN0_VANPL|nr:hypothetical protein HPP92_024735 [Vanilla planifolia]